MKNFIFRTIFVFTIVLFFLPVMANACFCGGGGPACQDFGNTFAVFSGKVESITDSPREYSPVPGRKYNLIDKRVIFTVTNAYRGISENKVEIITSGQSSSCGYRFEIGKEYMVYARQNKETGTLDTGICSRTRPIEKADEDLQYFREVSAKTYNTNIYGGVFRVFTRKNNEPYRQPEPMPNITLTLSNGEKIVTDEKGEYRFGKLLPQEYTITPTVPNGLWGGDKPERKAKLNPNGCALIHFVFVANTSLSGRVLDENGHPAGKISVQLVPVDQINIHQSDTQMGFTDKDGRFVFHTIPSGDYYLGVRLFRIAELLFPYPRTFYPNTVNLNEAKVINIKEGDVLKDFEIKLGQKLKQRTVSGIVVNADGTPASKASISVQEIEYSKNSMGQAFQANEDGTFSLTLLDGLRHQISAYVTVKNPFRQNHSERIEIPANGEVTNLTLKIIEPK